MAPPFGTSLSQKDPKVGNPQIARGMAQSLLAYGWGARRFADRRAVDAIVAKSAKDDYGLRSLLYAAVESPLFLNK
ncbi:MAG: DUF1585 domain-containing protein [Bryobacterales bacterium]